MTDVRFLNDASELDYSLRVIAEVVGDVKTPSMKAAADVLAGLRRPAMTIFETFNVFAICFCLNPDLLSQWRGYGGDQGFAIGFERDAFGDDCWLMDYDRESSVRTVRELVARFIAESDGLPPNTEVTEPSFFKVFHEFAWNLFTAALKMKHPSFREEEESRFVLLGKAGDLESVRFRPNRYGLVPYVPVSRLDGKWRSSEHEGPRDKLPIVSIKCGPTAHPAIAETGVKICLQRSGYSNVDVSSSTIPLRT